jgi:hypothetical protein
MLLFSMRCKDFATCYPPIQPQVLITQSLVRNKVEPRTALKNVNFGDEGDDQGYLLDALCGLLQPVMNTKHTLNDITDNMQTLINMLSTQMPSDRMTAAQFAKSYDHDWEMKLTPEFVQEQLAYIKSTQEVIHTLRGFS